MWQWGVHGRGASDAGGKVNERRDGQYSERHASYWNALLYEVKFVFLVLESNPNKRHSISDGNSDMKNKTMVVSTILV